MLSISDIRNNQTLLDLVETIVADFLQYQLSTSEFEIYKKVEGRDDVITSLVNHGFLQPNFADKLIPGLLAFEYGKDPERLRQAKGYTDMVLRTLGSLFQQAEYKQRQFKFDEIFAHVKQNHPFARQEHVGLGLLLVPILDKFLVGYQWNNEHSTFDVVEVDKKVLVYKSIDTAWSAKVNEILDRDKGAQAELKRAKVKNDTIETAFNRYELFESIGDGAAGCVRRAKDSDGNDVAIKILNPRYASSEKRKRFQNEIRFSSQTRHPHLIGVLDWGLMTVAGQSTVFYVMPRFHSSLRTLMQTIVDSNQRLKYFEQLLNGVEAAHGAGVVHRDLKPENVLYDVDGDSLVVADFGIAHFNDEELYTAVETKHDARLGNFQYAAPEQRNRGQATDERTDIFALGLILNELFTGKVPHGAEYKKIASVAPEYAWIDEIVARMIQQDPLGRPLIDIVKRSLFPRQQTSRLENQSDKPIATPHSNGKKGLEAIIWTQESREDCLGILIKNASAASLENVEVVTREFVEWSDTGHDFIRRSQALGAVVIRKARALDGSNDWSEFLPIVDRTQVESLRIIAPHALNNHKTEVVHLLEKPGTYRIQIRFLMKDDYRDEYLYVKWQRGAKPAFTQHPNVRF